MLETYLFSEAPRENEKYVRFLNYMISNIFRFIQPFSTNFRIHWLHFTYVSKENRMVAASGWASLCFHNWDPLFRVSPEIADSKWLIGRSNVNGKWFWVRINREFEKTWLELGGPTVHHQLKKSAIVLLSSFSFAQLINIDF